MCSPLRLFTDTVSFRRILKSIRFAFSRSIPDFFFFWRNTLLPTTFWLLSWSNLIMVISKGIGLARVIDVLMLKNHVTDRSICSPRQNSLGTWFAKDEEWKDNEKDFEENCFQTTWWAWGHKHSSRTWYRWSAYFPCRWLIHFNHNCSRATT